MTTVTQVVDIVVRSLALAGVAVAGVIAATHWAVRQRKLGAFNGWSRAVRHVSDPLLRPIEQRLVRRGGNPQDATFWLLGIAIIAGLLLIGITRWLAAMVWTIVQLSDASAGTRLRVAVDWMFGLLMLALIVRVIGSWFGISPYTSRIMRIAHQLTNWIVNPIRRLLPKFGMIDLSPLVAYLALMLVRAFLHAALV